MSVESAPAAQVMQTRQTHQLRAAPRALPARHWLWVCVARDLLQWVQWMQRLPVLPPRAESLAQQLAHALPQIQATAAHLL